MNTLCYLHFFFAISLFFLFFFLVFRKSRRRVGYSPTAEQRSFLIVSIASAPARVSLGFWKNNTERAVVDAIMPTEEGKVGTRARGKCLSRPSSFEYAYTRDTRGRYSPAAGISFFFFFLNRSQSIIMRKKLSFLYPHGDKL